MRDVIDLERRSGRDAGDCIHFAASMDRLHRVSTALALTSLIVALAVLIYQGSLASHAGQTAMFFGFAGVLIVMALSLWLFAPLSYDVTSGAVIIRRWVYDVRIAMDQIQSARVVELHGVMRTCGVGGFLGSWGWFRSRELPQFFACVRHRRPLVCLELDGAAPVVLSPDDAERFIAEVSQRMRGPGHWS